MMDELLRDFKKIVKAYIKSDLTLIAFLDENNIALED